MSDTIVRDLFDRIPALGELRGFARIEAEEVLRNAIDDAIEEYLVDGEPGVDGEETVRDALVRDARARALHRAGRGP